MYKSSPRQLQNLKVTANKQTIKAAKASSAPIIPKITVFTVTSCQDATKLDLSELVTRTSIDKKVGKVV